jgi:hypothetical protein
MARFVGSDFCFVEKRNAYVVQAFEQAPARIHPPQVYGEASIIVDNVFQNQPSADKEVVSARRPISAT